MTTLQDPELLDVIVDAGESAKSLNRPGMDRLLAMVDAGEVQTVIVAKLDRLTRSVKDLATLLERFEKRGVGLVSVAESLDTGSAAGRPVLNIIVSVSQWELEAIGERTKDAMRHKKASAQLVGAVPFGYRLAAAGVSDAALMSIAGHISRKMMEHYSHVRMAAKREAIATLGGGLLAPEPDAEEATDKVNWKLSERERSGG
jgi:hypothetical protein